MDNLDKNIRKLRKKLRQIDQLTTVTRSLNDEENQKVAKLPEIRNELQSLLKEKQSQSKDSSNEDDFSRETDFCSGDEPMTALEARDLEAPSQDFQLTDDEDKKEEKKEEEEEEKKEEEEERRKEDPVMVVTKRKTEESVAEDLSAKVPQPEQKKKKLQQQPEAKKQQKEQQPEAKKQQQKAPWWRAKPRYFVQELVGHQDIILDVSIADGLFASASRDSQVKLWSLDSGALECTLSGHSEAVQACILLPVAASAALAEALSVPPTSRLVVTGGGDSHLLLWRVDPGLRTGTELRRIYMFTPITGLVHLESEEGLIVALGTSSGKIEVWNLLEKRLERSRQIHRSPVTCVRLVAASNSASTHLLSCSEEGEVALLRASDLGTAYVAGETGSRRSVRHNSALALGSERLLVADSGASLKLHRKGHQGVQRVPNSRHEFGLCDALWSDNATLVVATAFDVDNGRGYFNFHNFETPARPTYLMSLEPPQCSGRFLCLDAVGDSKPDFPEAIVTGGVDLLLWQRLPTDTDFSEAECSRTRTYRLFRLPAGQDSDASGPSSDETSGSEEEWEERKDQLATRSWWWCELL